MRRRILVAIAGVAAGAVFLLALPLGLAVQRLYRDDEVLKLERNATAAARGFDPRSAPGDPVEFPPSTDRFAAYSLAGRLIGGQGPARSDAIVEATLASGEVDDVVVGGRLVVAVPVLGGERVVGAIRASRSTAELDERVLRVRLLIGGGALAIVALAMVAALLLSRRLTRPLGELAEVAAAVGGRGPVPTAPRSGMVELDVVAEVLDAMVARVGELVSRERAFSANASHQLRTPLAALRLELESRQLAGAEVNEPMVQVERLERTIDTLLATARDAPIDREPFAVDDLLEEAQRRWIGPLAELGRALEIVPGAGRVEAVASRAAIDEVIDVLIDNACRHGAGTVRVRSRPVGGDLALDVSDEGRLTTAPHELFVRGAGMSHGIGLALARSLAEAEGGRLDLSDDAQGSTTFTLLLRGADDKRPDSPSPRQPSRPSDSGR